MNKHAFLRRALPVGAALAIGTGAGAAIYAGSAGHSASNPTTVVASVPAQPAAATTTSLTQLYKNVSPGVVDIVVNTNSGGFGDQGATAEGSGFVVDTSGDIVTNDHVVTGATAIKVRFQNGKTVKAKLVGTDPSTDVAVIKVSVAASDLHPLTFAQLFGRRSRPARRGHRQPVRPTGDADLRNRQRRQPHDHGAEQLLDLRRDPDGRSDQPRQLRRPAAQRERPGHRRERPDRK